MTAIISGSTRTFWRVHGTRPSIYVNYKPVHFQTDHADRAAAEAWIARKARVGWKATALQKVTETVENIDTEEPTK